MNDTDLFELACKLDDLAENLAQRTVNTDTAAAKLFDLADRIREKLEEKAEAKA